jgi:hypothetical protein
MVVLDNDPPTYAVVTTGAYHHIWVVGQNGVLLTFYQTCLEVLSSQSLISASQVAGIPDVHCHACNQEKLFQHSLIYHTKNKRKKLRFR